MILRLASLLLAAPFALAQPEVTTITFSASATSSGPFASASSSLSASASVSGNATSMSGSFSVLSAQSTSTSAVPSPPTTTIHSIPISATSFSPIPVPSPFIVPWVYPLADPLGPPEVGSSMVPDYYPAWRTAYSKAQDLISYFTLEEKVNVTTGLGWQVERCVGNIGPLERHGFPGLCLQDSPLGVRFADYVTAFPAGINTAATWNKRLIRERGLALGEEFRGKGVHIALGPMMNMGRIAQGGRNFEGFGADPYLAGEAAYETILGMQQAGIQACAKHLVNNEQEHKRTMESSLVDDRTQHEIYLHPFMRSIMAGVASIMCSYNLINGTYACENDKILNDVVKREFGFQGYIMSDWAATMSTMSAATGLDMTMPGDITFNSGTSYFGANLTAYVQNGTIPEERLDDMATRILAAWYFLHQDGDDFPEVSFDSFHPLSEENNTHVDVQDDHDKLVRDIGAASTVLLKNVNNTLPLKKPRSILLAGSDAGPARVGPNHFADQGGTDGVLAMGWGSGTANFTYLISPLEAIQRRARKNRTTVSWILDDWDLATAASMALSRSAALVFINSDSGEQYIAFDGNEGDRNNLTAWNNGDNMVLAVAENCNNTIVVVHSTGPIIMEPWVEHPNVTAVVWAGVPGNEAGNAITDVLYGDWNPSGRLPFTIAKRTEDYGAQPVLGGGADDILDIVYHEGLEIDYRHFDAKNVEPRFEFGFGLSYTEWTYTDLEISTIVSDPYQQSDLEDAWARGEASPIDEGSTTALWLHRPAFNVTFQVENTGNVFGGDIPQLYLNFPTSAGEPPSVLKGFTNLEALPGETKTVSLLLSRYDVSIWDAGLQGWRRPEGTIAVTVGRSSRNGLLFGQVP